MTLTRAARLLLALLLTFGLALWLGNPDAAIEQFRETPDSPPTLRFLLGTDSVGRDRLVRLLQGTAVSLLLAPAAALITTVLAAVLGGLAGLRGGFVDRTVMGAADLFLSIPWLFLLLTVRALLPLDLAPVVSLLLVFTLLGVLGWAAPARVVRSAVGEIRRTEHLLQARALGWSPIQLLIRQVWPALRPILATQCLLHVPLFALTEANLGLLGLGVSEPFASLGGLLRELESPLLVWEQPWRLAPLVMLILLVLAIQTAFPADTETV